MTTDQSNSSPAPTSAAVEWDDARNEPFILIPGQPDFRLTPLRAGDEDDIVRLCNDPSVGQWTYRRAFPYTRAHAEWWINHVVPQYRTFFPQVREALQHASPPPMHELRVVLRHVPVGPESDTSAYLAKQGIPPEAQLGSMHLWPSEWEGLSEAEMLALPPGEQVWEIAYDLLPGLRGRGLGKGMILAAMDGWIKWLGIGTVIAGVQTVNAASRAVARKCGFKEGKVYMKQWPEEKGGGEREMSRWVWTPAS